MGFYSASFISGSDWESRYASSADFVVSRFFPLELLSIYTELSTSCRPRSVFSSLASALTATTFCD